jgi:hypothetical protein
MGQQNARSNSEQARLNDQAIAGVAVQRECTPLSCAPPEKIASGEPSA